MKKIYPKLHNLLVNQTYAAVAFVLFVAIVATASPVSAAAAQMTSRSITMSDSGPSGGAITSGVGSGTGVTYTVSFILPTASLSAIIDFCSDSAIVGAACANGAAGMSAFSAASATVTNSAGQVGTWTLTKTQYTIKLAGAATPSTAGATQTFTINNITNPSGNLAFYARMYTYSNNSFGTPTAWTAPATPGSYIDFGSVALTTNSVITITAKVQETLIFCVSAASPTANCGGTTTPAVSLGHGTNTTLDSTAIDTGTVYSQISTNAGNGASIRIKSSTADGGLASTGSNSIPPIGGGGTTPTTMTAGQAAFGLRIAATGGAAMTVAAPYADAAKYSFDTTTSTNNAITGYGSQVVSSIAPVNNYANTWTFAATAANTTPAGLYAANISVIATGTF